MIDRRDFLRAGLTTLGALSLPRSARAGGSRRKLLVYFNNGGWDTSFVFDPHFDSSIVAGDDQATAANIGGIDFADAGSRPSVRSFLEANSHHTAFINGISVSSISHSQCIRLILTGTRSSSAPDLPALLAAGIGSDLPTPYLVVSGPRFPGPLTRYMVPLSRTLTATSQGQLPEGIPYSPDTEALIRAYLADEAARLDDGGLITQFGEGLVRQDALGAVGLQVSESSMFEQDLNNALAALSADAAAAVMIEGDLPQLTAWDSHSDNYLKQDGAFEHTFGRLTDLMSMLESTPDSSGQPLSETTTVLVISEMGRTPAYNGTLGKDHWPVTSAMLVGAGVAGGQVVGATDDALSSVPVDFTSGAATDSGAVLDITNVLAGILAEFGVDPGEAFPDVAPFTAPFG